MYPCNSTTKTTWWQMQMNWFTILRQITVIIVESVLILIGLWYERFYNPFSYTNKGEWWREWFIQLVYFAQVLQEPFIYIAVWNPCKILCVQPGQIWMGFARFLLCRTHVEYFVQNPVRFTWVLHKFYRVKPVQNTLCKTQADLHRFCTDSFV